VREIIKNYYNFSNSKKLYNYIVMLLRNCVFLSINYQRTNILLKIFQASIIVKIFVLLFFNSNRKSFATNFIIRYLFMKLSLKIIKIVYIIICYCIEEFRHEACITIKFEKN